jgi:hypothetical protein
VNRRWSEWFEDVIVALTDEGSRADELAPRLRANRLLEAVAAEPADLCGRVDLLTQSDT